VMAPTFPGPPDVWEGAAVNALAGPSERQA
jgi:hypothetical protein